MLGLFLHLIVGEMVTVAPCQLVPRGYRATAPWCWSHETWRVDGWLLGITINNPPPAPELATQHKATSHHQWRCRTRDESRSHTALTLKQSSNGPKTPSGEPDAAFFSSRGVVSVAARSPLGSWRKLVLTSTTRCKPLHIFWLPSSRAKAQGGKMPMLTSTRRHQLSVSPVQSSPTTKTASDSRAARQIPILPRH